MCKENGYEFKHKPRETEPIVFLQQLVGGRVETVSTIRRLKAVDCYANEEGMLKNLFFNSYANPFIQKMHLIELSKYAGLFGPIVLYKRGGHSIDLLIELCKIQSKKENCYHENEDDMVVEEDVESFYVTRMDEAITLCEQ